MTDDFDPYGTDYLDREFDDEIAVRPSVPAGKARADHGPAEPDERGIESATDAYGDDSDPELRPCPHCGIEIYEDAAACNRCGELIDWRQQGTIWDHRPGWYILLGVAGIVTTCLACALGYVLL